MVNRLGFIQESKACAGRWIWCILEKNSAIQEERKRVLLIFRSCMATEIRPLMKEYLKSLSSPFDSFLEGYILSSAFYSILDGEQEVGFYAIHNNARRKRNKMEPKGPCVF
ncbi:hypothetical protein H7B67_09110 [Cohnella thailandensis]|uniref:Acetyltransferase (GNAT) domain-containing protein n=3 Tax=Cohnella thailandensis TaxID=557557 RepID=A0A841SXC1_9BACL|nr:hypothetical protein [Cohnella thailandensis]